MGGVRSFIEHYLEYYERSLYVYGHDACRYIAGRYISSYYAQFVG